MSVKAPGYPTAIGSVPVGSLAPIAGDTVIGNPTGSAAIPTATTSPNVSGTITAGNFSTGGSLSFTGDLVFSTSNSPAQQSWISQPVLTISGQAGALAFGATPALATISNSYDSVETETYGASYLNNLYVFGAPGTNHTGGRSAIWGELDIVGIPATSATNYPAGQFVTSCNANLTSGAFYGLASQAKVNSSGASVSFLTGCEFAATILSGAAGSRYGLDIAQSGSFRGTNDDAALSIRGAASCTWLYGVEFGGASSSWSMGADSTLIGAVPRSIGGSGACIALNGVDWRQVTFQSGGKAFASPGFSVDPSGNAIVNSLTIGTTFQTPIILGSSNTAVAHTGDTADTNVAVVTIPAGLMSANGALRITSYWQFTNNANTKTAFITHSSISGNVGGTNVLTTSVTTQTAGQFQNILRNANSVSSQILSGSGTGVPFGTFAGAPATAAINTANVSYINFNVQNTTSGSDTTTLLGYTVEYIPSV